MARAASRSGRWPGDSLTIPLMQRARRDSSPACLPRPTTQQPRRPTARDRRRRLSPRAGPRISSPENGIRNGGANIRTSKGPVSSGTSPTIARIHPAAPMTEPNKDVNGRRHDPGPSTGGWPDRCRWWLGGTAPAPRRDRGRGLKALTAVGVQVRRSRATSVHGLSSVTHHRLYRRGKAVGSVTRRRSMGCDSPGRLSMRGDVEVQSAAARKHRGPTSKPTTQRDAASSSVLTRLVLMTRSSCLLSTTVHLRPRARRSRSDSST